MTLTPKSVLAEKYLQAVRKANVNGADCLLSGRELPSHNHPSPGEKLVELDILRELFHFQKKEAARLGLSYPSTASILSILQAQKQENARLSQENRHLKARLDSMNMYREELHLKRGVEAAVEEGKGLLLATAIRNASGSS